MARGRKSKLTGSLTESEFDIAARALGYYDPDNLRPSYQAAKAVMVFGHPLTRAASIFDIWPTAVSQTCYRINKALEEMPGKHRKCPCCGSIMERRDWN